MHWLQSKGYEKASHVEDRPLPLMELADLETVRCCKWLHKQRHGTARL
jgi:hypothetical protein